jgi:hypothetical protein
MALAVTLALVSVVVTPVPIAAYTGREPVLLVHGHSPGGVGHCGRWETLARQLRSPDTGHAPYRFDGGVIPIGFYGGATRTGRAWGESGCGWRAHLSSFGRHDRVHASGHATRRGIVGHTPDTSIRHLAYHLAWLIYQRFTRRGIHVDVVGLSMGGLIVRYAVAATRLHARHFPPRLLVDDVVTLGTPLGGHETSLFSAVNRQTLEMDAGSPLMAWLHDHAYRPPKGAGGGTDWTFVGSSQDEWIPKDSAVGLRCDELAECEPWQLAQHSVVYDDVASEDAAQVTHNAYHTLGGYRPSHRAQVRRGGQWVTSGSFVPPIRLVEWALVRDDW